MQCNTSNILVNYHEHKYVTVVVDLNNEGGSGGKQYDTDRKREIVKHRDTDMTSYITS